MALFEIIIIYYNLEGRQHYNTKERRYETMPEIGIITEQGDLGFGFEPLNESDKAQYDKAQKDKETDKENK